MLDSAHGCKVECCFFIDYFSSKRHLLTERCPDVNNIYCDKIAGMLRDMLPFAGLS